MKRRITFSLIIGFLTLFFYSCNKKKPAEEKTTDTTTYRVPAPRKVESDKSTAKSLGVAYLEENKLDQAEEQFKKLIDLAPDDASGYANLGVVYLRKGRLDDAERYLKKATELNPGDPDIRLNLAKVYELKNDKKASIQELKKSEKISPDHVKTLFSIAEKYQGSRDKESVAEWERYMRKIVEKSPANIVARMYLVEALVRGGKADEALKNLEEAQQIFPEFPDDAKPYYDASIEALQKNDLEKALTSILIFHNYLKLTPEYQGGIRELKGAQSGSAGQPVISFSKTAPAGLEEGESILDIIKFNDATRGAGLDFSASGRLDSGRTYFSTISVGDMDNDGDYDLYYAGWSGESGGSFRMLLVNDFGRYENIAESAGIKHYGRDWSAEFADYDNDGYPDLYICNDTSNVLYANVSKGTFADMTKKANLKGSGEKSLFVDYDHDGDLDLIVARKGHNLLFRNNGDGTFNQMEKPLAIMGSDYDTRSLAFGDFDNDGDIDIAMANADGPVRILSNLRQGRFKDVTQDSGVDFPEGGEKILVFDFNNDGQLDLLIMPGNGNTKLYRNKGDGTFQISDYTKTINNALEGVQCNDAAVFDFDNDGHSDLLFAGSRKDPQRKGVILLHNDGDGFSDVSGLLPDQIDGRQIALADYNQDGDPDIFLITMDGRIRLLRNDGGNANHHLKIQLVGLRTGSGKNNYFGIGATVEVRAGELYQMKVIKKPSTLFGLGNHEKADVVRILWTNGTPQNIFSPGSDQDLIETQELKGSCPFLYTWNGRAFEFLKDMMWRSALGMPMGIMGGKTAYAFPDASEEYLKIPGEKLLEKDGQLVLQVTEELWETIYFDKLRLIAVDHPAGTDIFVDEKFAAPPYPDFKVYAIETPRTPVSAHDGKGNDVLPFIVKKDGKYLSNFRKAKYQGITEMKDLILDLGEVPDTANLYLFCNGWIFPTDASINAALSQSDQIRIKNPSLEVINGEGKWEEVMANIGFPAGKNKTLVVDLSGIFLSSERKIRIRTNMEIYWDYIFFGSSVDAGIKLKVLSPASADHHYRGFSREYRKGGRYGPHWFDYREVTSGQKWRDLTGAYTRYGDVTELLQEADDRYIIANAGDETTIRFDADQLQDLPSGWMRDYIIFSVGWVKDGDLNTATGQTVKPLPFHGMKVYPYGDDEPYPATEDLSEYQKKYNTRIVDTERFKNFLSDGYESRQTAIH